MSQRRVYAVSTSYPHRIHIVSTSYPHRIHILTTGCSVCGPDKWVGMSPPTYPASPPACGLGFPHPHIRPRPNMWVGISPPTYPRSPLHVGWDFVAHISLRATFSHVHAWQRIPSVQSSRAPRSGAPNFHPATLSYIDSESILFSPASFRL